MEGRAALRAGSQASLVLAPLRHLGPWLRVPLCLQPWLRTKAWQHLRPLRHLRLQLQEWLQPRPPLHPPLPSRP